jgi:hypothetical protein
MLQEKSLFLPFQIHCKMRRLFPSLFFLLLVLGFTACSTDVELYADYKDIPIVYGLIDVTQDTNYIRINRAFSGSNESSVNANEVALIEDSCNYPGKLDAKIYRYKCVFGNNFVIDTLTDDHGVNVLDTMTLHNKQEGVFYAPDQKVYYTTDKNFFKVNTANARYKYKLVVLKQQDTISAETSLVGGENFRIVTSMVGFAPNSQNFSKVKFVGAENALVYEVRMVFNYKEKIHNGPMTDKQVSWSLGTVNVNDLDIENGSYSMNYSQTALFTQLASKIGGDTINAERYIGDFNIIVAAGGEEFYNYIQVNAPNGGFNQTVPEYTNVHGGFGVFSSRINIMKTVQLNARTQTELIGMNWGFKQQ